MGHCRIGMAPRHETATWPDGRAAGRREPRASNGCHLPEVLNPARCTLPLSHAPRRSAEARTGRERFRSQTEADTEAETSCYLVTDPRQARGRRRKLYAAATLSILLLRFYGRHMPQSPLLMQQWLGSMVLVQLQRRPPPPWRPCTPSTGAHSFRRLLVAPRADDEEP